MTQELESQGPTQPGKHQCNAVGPGEEQAEGMRRSDQAFQWTRRGRDSHPACPRLLTPLLPKCAGGTRPGAQPAGGAAHTAMALAFAGVDFLTLGALSALHVAAPAHLALAGPCHHPALRVVATPTADALAVLLAVAPAASGARGEAAS